MGGFFSKLGLQKNAQESPLIPPYSGPLFSSDSVFLHINDEFGSCLPHGVAFKDYALPDMHIISEDRGITKMIDLKTVLPFHNATYEYILTPAGDHHELVRQGATRKRFAVLVMRHTVRGLVIELTANLKKLEHVADYIVVFMILPERAKMGMIEKLDHLGFPRAVLMRAEHYTPTPDEVILCENIMLNNSLLDLPPLEFSKYAETLKQCHQSMMQDTTTFLEHSSGLDGSHPRVTSILDVHAKGSDEIQVSWDHSFCGAGWIGLFRPHVSDINRCMAKFLVEENATTRLISMRPVPFGDVILRRFNNEGRETAISEPTCFGGEFIEVSGRRHDATSIDLEVTGPLPKAWHVAVFTNGKKVEKSHESSDQVRVVLVENEDEYTLVVNVIATMWNDCLVVRSVRVK